MWTIAQYTLTEVEPIAIFGFSVTAQNVLAVVGFALAMVAVYKISVGIGKKVIEWMSGESIEWPRLSDMEEVEMSRMNRTDDVKHKRDILKDPAWGATLGERKARAAGLKRADDLNGGGWSGKKLSGKSGDIPF